MYGTLQGGHYLSGSPSQILNNQTSVWCNDYELLWFASQNLLNQMCTAAQQQEQHQHNMNSSQVSDFIFDYLDSVNTCIFPCTGTITAYIPVAADWPIYGFKCTWSNHDIIEAYYIQYLTLLTKVNFVDSPPNVYGKAQ